MRSNARAFVANRPAALVGLSAALVLGTFAGCKSGTDDNTLDKNVHNALAGDPSLGQQPVQVAVHSGVVTLSGSVTDSTARSLAAQDAARVQGVKEVVNNLSVAGVAATPTITSPAAPYNPTPATPDQQVAIAHNRPLPPPRETTARHEPEPRYPANPQPAPGPQPPPAARPEPARAPEPPPAPVARLITVPVPEGTAIPVRVTETLDSATAQPGQNFHGVVARDVVVNGYTVLPAGSPVTGRVTDVKEASHFKGSSLLAVELTGVRRHGEGIPVHTEPYSVEGKSRSTNTAEKVGGGAAVGAILGGIFGGGKGAAIGAAAGGGTGAGVQEMTRGQQVQIPSESVVRFRLTSGFSVRTEEQVAPHEQPSGLQQRY